jgi:hypothetical protein
MTVGELIEQRNAAVRRCAELEEQNKNLRSYLEFYERKYMALAEEHTEYVGAMMAPSSRLC